MLLDTGLKRAPHGVAKFGLHGHVFGVPAKGAVRRLRFLTFDMLPQAKVQAIDGAQPQSPSSIA